MMCRYLVFLILLCSSSVFADTLTGRVVGVADGDTVTVLTSQKQQVRIRLAGIDAPEKAQDFGQVSKKALSDRVFGRDVVVIDDGKDRYGRTIGWIEVDGYSVNAAQVNDGMAWVYRNYIDQKSERGMRMLALEEGAKNAKRGLWSHSYPIAPWEFRRNKSRNE